MRTLVYLGRQAGLSAGAEYVSLGWHLLFPISFSPLAPGVLVWPPVSLWREQSGLLAHGGLYVCHIVAAFLTLRGLT